MKPTTIPRLFGGLLLLLALVGPKTGLSQNIEGALNRYIDESLTVTDRNAPAAGSLYLSHSFLAEPARDPKAGQVGDLITILIAEQASALSSGATSQSRDSESDNSVSKFFGVVGATSGLANLVGSAGERSLSGQGSTSRQTSVTTTLTGHVTHVMPNGNLVIEGTKEVAVNSERQRVWLRGVIRPADLNPDNSVSSNRVALMDLRVNGRGVVNDAIRRPNVIYRIFQRILPF